MQIFEAEPLPETEAITPLEKWERDMKNASRLMKHEEARWLVQRYYQLQDYRIQSANQVNKKAADGEPANDPNQMLQWLAKQDRTLELNIQSSLKIFAGEFRVGKWLQNLHGVGPVLSAGALSYFDIRRAKYAGSYWRYAGMAPKSVWISAKKTEAGMAAFRESIGHTGKLLTGDEALRFGDYISGQKFSSQRSLIEGWMRRNYSVDGYEPDDIAKAASMPPYNEDVKKFCWKFADVQCKHRNAKNPDETRKSIYGQLYDDYKERIEKKNASGGFAERAAQILKEKKIGKSTDSYKAYKKGFLPKGQIHNMALRYIAKLWLSHLWEVSYRDYYGTAVPKPWILGEEGHSHYIAPPGLEGWTEPGLPKDFFPGRSMRSMFGETEGEIM